MNPAEQGPAVIVRLGRCGFGDGGIGRIDWRSEAMPEPIILAFAVPETSDLLGGAQRIAAGTDAADRFAALLRRPSGSSAWRH